MNTLLFHVGDKVVYPNHGVGTIEQISSRSFATGTQQFYLLKIEASNLRVMVPFNSVAAVGMRPVAKSIDVARAMEFLERGECKFAADWKWRFKENSDKMRTGSLLQIAEVLKGLLQLNESKPLSFREKKMLDRALQLMLNEMCTVKHVHCGQAMELLQRALAKAHLHLPVPERTDA
jgi:CarD family transcriptional regulator